MPSRGPVAATTLGKPAVWVVEDSAVHAKFLVEAMARTARPPAVRTFTDAETAWPVISDLVRQPRAQWPRLAIIDLGLPNASGLDLLERIRRNAAFQDWPVIILTASQHEADIQAARGAKATAYYTKPVDVNGYLKLANDLVDLWLPRA
ncbi:MAG: response regulator [Thermoplasmatota archaeon]